MWERGEICNGIFTAYLRTGGSAASPKKKRILTNAVAGGGQKVAHCGARTTFAFFLAVLNYSGSAHKSRKRAKNAREKDERECLH